MSRSGLTARQMMEGLALGFDPSACTANEAVIELSLTGDEAAAFQLVIRDGACRFEPEPVRPPTLRIVTDAEAWRAVIEGRGDAAAAMAAGKLRATGDMALFEQLPRLFRRLGADGLRAPADQRAPGPVRLPAMAWLALAFVPWKVFGVLTELRGPLFGSLGALLVATAIWIAREATGGATFFERGTAVVLGAITVPLALGARPASGLLPISLLSLAALWAASVSFARYPVTGDYARWTYTPRLWKTGLFRHPNIVLTLLWSGIFLVAGVLEAASARGWIASDASTVLSFALLISGSLFTARRQRGMRNHRIDDLDRGLVRLEAVARGLLCVVGAAFFLTADPRRELAWIIVPTVACVAAAIAASRARTLVRLQLALVFGAVLLAPSLAVADEPSPADRGELVLQHAIRTGSEEARQSRVANGLTLGLLGTTALVPGILLASSQDQEKQFIGVGFVAAGSAQLLPVPLTLLQTPIERIDDHLAEGMAQGESPRTLIPRLEGELAEAAARKWTTRRYVGGTLATLGAIGLGVGTSLLLANPNDRHDQNLWGALSTGLGAPLFTIGMRFLLVRSPEESAWADYQAARAGVGRGDSGGLTLVSMGVAVTNGGGVGVLQFSI
jgi:hypothetical protein